MSGRHFSLNFLFFSYSQHTANIFISTFFSFFFRFFLFLSFFSFFFRFFSNGRSLLTDAIYRHLKNICKTLARELRRQLQRNCDAFPLCKGLAREIFPLQILVTLRKNVYHQPIHFFAILNVFHK